MKRILFAAALTLALASVAHADTLDGLWVGDLYPTASTCPAGNPLYIFKDGYVVKGNTLTKRLRTASGVFRKVGRATFRTKFNRLDRADIHFGKIGTDGSSLVSYTDTFGRCHPGDGRLLCECQTVWQGEFGRQP